MEKINIHTYIYIYVIGFEQMCPIVKANRPGLQMIDKLAECF